jgi:hypothetical protein
MKELKIKTIHDNEYDVEINPLLSATQIDKIAQAVIKLETYLEREQMICYLVLNYCTNIDKEIIEDTDPDVIMRSGLWEVVKTTVYNFYEIEDAIKFYESPVRMLAEIADVLPDLTKQLQGVDLGEVIKSGLSK